MKKLLFFLTIGSVALSAQAQESSSVILNRSAINPINKSVRPLSVEKMDAMHNMPYCKNNSRGARTTTLYTDWYDLWNQNYTSGTSLGYYFETFPDSNLYDATSSEHIFWHGMGMCFDPTDSGYFSTAFNIFGGLPTLVASVTNPMPLTNATWPLANPTYSIDSIYVPVGYIRNDNSSIDTLIIEITQAVGATVYDTGTYNLHFNSTAGITWWSADHAPRFGTIHYNPGAGSFPVQPAPYNSAMYTNDCYFDSVYMVRQRYALVLPNNTQLATDTDANGNLLLGALQVASAISGAGPGASTAMTAPSGYPYAGLYSFPMFSAFNVNTQSGLNPHPTTFITFKSGHTGGTYPLGTTTTAGNWIKLYAGEPAGTGNFFQQASSNGSTYPGSYQSTVYTDNGNRYSDTGYTFNGHDVLIGSTAYGSAPSGGTAWQLAVQEAAFHITWSPTPASGVINVNELNNVTATPNPANTQLNITFTGAANTAVTVSLTNMIGQTVATQNAVNGRAIFSTSTLPEGVYVYTLEANGQRTTGRVVVAH